MQLEEFLKRQNEFNLGHLPTEGFHPETKNLSDLVNTDLESAISTLQRIDVAAIEKVLAQKERIEELSRAIHQVFESGNRVYLSGCGATGRLALALESSWRRAHRGGERENSIQALMAGGDFALVKSVENFEDFPEYGKRHLHDLGFRKGDLLIAITEGGETPYVIGTVHAALEIGGLKPWFIYCNPTDVLCKTVERSRNVIQNKNVETLCIDTGPMALSGSTRLQAATVQMLAVGVALWKDFLLVAQLKEAYSRLNLARFLTPAIEWESTVYKNNNFVMYQSDDFPIAVLTDTTERSPTFSLTPFEKKNDFHPSNYSLCYLSIPDARTSEEAWNAILQRTPIGLEWEELNGRLGANSILDFDFSSRVLNTRERKLFPCEQHVIELSRSVTLGHTVVTQLELRTEIFSNILETSLLDHPLLSQILVKMILNIHSLMVMGKLGRYEGNVMTWVRASNGKLIDRTLRYLNFLIDKRGLKNPGRDQLLEMIFSRMTEIGTAEAMVLHILEELTPPSEVS